MNVDYGNGSTQYGPGVSIELSGDEVAQAINAYLVAHDVHVYGSRTVTVNGDLCQDGKVYVDPSGFVIASGKKFLGSGPEISEAEERAELARLKEKYEAREGD